MTLRAFVRDMPGNTAASQMARATKLGATVIYEADRSLPDKRDAWLRSLRPNDTAVIDKLALLASHPPKQGVRPSADFAGALTRLLLAGCRIVEASTGVTSDDKDALAAAVIAAADQIASGRRLTPRRAREIGRAGVEAAIERSPVRRWTSPEMSAQRKRYGAIWRDSQYTNDDDAAEAVNAALREDGKPELGSPSTMRRIFERRRPRQR